jgi:hypothetical protein
MLHGNFLSFLYHSTIPMIPFYVPFTGRRAESADVLRWDAWYFPCFVWDCVHASAVKPRSKILLLHLLLSNLIHHNLFFCSLVDKGDLLNQFLNAGNLINKLPASSSAGCTKCYKPEAHLLIKKVFIFENRKLSLSFYCEYDTAHQS